MNVAEKEEKIIKLNDERRNLIEEAKKPHSSVEVKILTEKIIEINKKIEELTKSGQVNRS